MAGTIVADTLEDGSSNSGSVTDAIKGSARAWLNFNGSTATATANMDGARNSYNIASIVDISTGNYRINFSTAMPNADYNVSGITGKASVAAWTSNYPMLCLVSAPTTGYFEIQTGWDEGDYDMEHIHLIVHGD